MKVEVRPEREGDGAAIGAVTDAAFLGAAHSDGQEASIVEGLRRAGALAVSLVAEWEGQVVGHVAVSAVSISGGAPGWYGLGPISVRPDCQRLGVGRRLMEAALDALRKRGAAGCVVLGDPSYYERFGFRALPELVLPGVPPEYFQVLPFGASFPTGVVAYHSAFGAVG